MPDPVKEDLNIRTVHKQETTEILDSSGRTLQRSNALHSIFDKMQEGKPVGDAAKEVEIEHQKAEKREEKKEEKKEVIEKAETKPDDLSKKLEQTQQKKADDEEISREKLRQQSEASPLTKDDKPIEEVIPEEELQVLATDKPKTAKRIQALLKKVETVNSTYAATKKERDELDAKRAELEKKLSEVKSVDPKTDEAVKAQLDELAMFRRRYDLDKDPEVKTKYDDRIVSAEKPIVDILTRHGAGEALLNVIKEEGGWLKFSQSTRPVTLKDGPAPAAEVADLILQTLPFGDRRTLESLATEQITTKREKDRYYEEQQKTASEYFKNKEDQAAKGSVEYQKQVEEARKMIEAWNKDVHEKHDWLKEKEVPATASAEQKAALEDDNKYTRQLKGLLKKAVETKDISGMLEVVLDSVQYYQERRAHSKTQAALAAEKKEVKRLQDELDKFKNAGKSVSRAGSISGAGTSPGEVKDKKPQSLTEALDIMARGGSLNEE